MIRWCAYCQTFQGEVPPLDSYEITHGVCDACVNDSRMTDADAIAAIRPLARFYRELRAHALRGFDASGDRLLEEATALGIEPVDLLIGMLQPALCEIGEAWSRGEVSVATEHRFTAAVESAASTACARLRCPAGVRQAPSPEVLLVNADGNYHTLGLKVLELTLLSGGCSTFLVEPGLPAREIAELARSLKPKVLGVSVALAEHHARIGEISEAMAPWPDGPRLVVGGSWVKMGARLDPALRAETCTDAQALLSALSRGSPKPNVDAPAPRIDLARSDRREDVVLRGDR